MTRNAQDIIDDMRNIVKPRIAKMLLEANWEGCGKEDKAEFETEFEAVLTLAEMALTMPKIPQNATNGDVIKAMFPNREVYDGYAVMYYDHIRVDKLFWFAPYKAESEEQNVGEN